MRIPLRLIFYRKGIRKFHKAQSLPFNSKITVIKKLLPSAFYFVLVSAISQVNSEAGRKTPNILVIISDDHALILLVPTDQLMD